jgi:hypothetical protein
VKSGDAFSDFQKTLSIVDVLKHMGGDDGKIGLGEEQREPREG